jgi:hypothetical protein
MGYSEVLKFIIIFDENMGKVKDKKIYNIKYIV